MARRAGPSAHFSLRLGQEARTALEALAAETGESRGALVERYIVQGTRRDRHPDIDVLWNPPFGWRARIVGRRIDVLDVIATLRATDNDPDAVAADLELPAFLVRACIDYYADHRDEIDAYASAAAAAADREHQTWLRRQDVLAG